jgi:hypothetical protein
MLCAPVVLLRMMYGVWIVGTIRSRVAVRETEEVTFSTKFRAVCVAFESVRLIVRSASEEKFGLP